jgi:phosphoenolpyruvate carboxykinase (GTP)
VLAWVFERCHEQSEAKETPIGLVPAEGALDTSGLDLADGAMAELLRVDPEEWRDQLSRLREHFAQFGDRLPVELAAQLDQLEARLAAG